MLIVAVQEIGEAHYYDQMAMVVYLKKLLAEWVRDCCCCCCCCCCCTVVPVNTSRQGDGSVSI